jgi:hypothetical protein
MWNRNRLQTVDPKIPLNKRGRVALQSPEQPLLLAAFRVPDNT